MKKEKRKFTIKDKADTALKIVAILEKEAGGYELEVLHTVASLLDGYVSVPLT